MTTASSTRSNSSLIIAIVIVAVAILGAVLGILVWAISTIRKRNNHIGEIRMSNLANNNSHGHENMYCTINE